MGWKRVIAIAIAIGAMSTMNGVASATADPKQTNAIEDEAADHKRNIFVRKFLFPDSSRRLLTETELEPLSCFDLWVARNEIYYRRGYCFREGRGQSYFGDDDCFLRRLPRLTRLEQQNITLIQRMERSHTCRR